MARRNTFGDALAAASANPPQDIPSGAKVSIAVLFPGLRPRHDGWTQARTQRFIDVLAFTGCVKDAARVAGMSATGARRMKRRFARFAAAWDDALGRAQQGLIAIAYSRAVEGRETVIIRKGEEYERRIEPSDAMLGLLLKRGDMMGGGLGGVGAEEMLSLDEWQRHLRFDGRGRKVRVEDPAVEHARFVEKMSLIRTRLEAHAAARHECPSCQQTLPVDWPRGSMAELVAGGLVDPDAL